MFYIDACRRNNADFWGWWRSLEKGESWSKLLTVPGLTEFVRPLCMSTGLVVLFQSSRHQSLRQDIGFSKWYLTVWIFLLLIIFSRKFTLSPCVKQNNKKSNQSNIPNKIITIPTLTSLCFEANFFFQVLVFTYREESGPLDQTVGWSKKSLRRVFFPSWSSDQILSWWKQECY